MPPLQCMTQWRQEEQLVRPAQEWYRLREGLVEEEGEGRERKSGGEIRYLSFGSGNLDVLGQVRGHWEMGVARVIVDNRE